MIVGCARVGTDGQSHDAQQAALRHLILSQTAEGKQKAKARGVRFGRKPKLTKYQQAEARARLRKARPWSRLRGATT